MRRTRRRSLIAAVLALTMVVAACGEADDADSGAQEEEEEPLALDLDESDEATEDEDEEAEEAEEEEEAEPEFDLVSAVDQHASTLPEGWMAVGDTEAFKDAMTVEDAVLIDIREEGEFADGHIPGAINIPIRTIPENLNLIPTDRPVWIYCASGWRAGMAASSLRLMGYDNLTVYPPGASGWAAAGEELVNEDNQAEDFGEPDLQPELVEAAGEFLSTLPDGFLGNSLDDVKQAVEAGAVVVDVRQPEEYEEGHIPDALSVPLREAASSEVEVPMDTNVIIACQSGYRASMALPIYHVLGYTNASGFPGSFAAWTEAGEAVTS